MLESIIIATTILATFANITVPVIPDPEYLRSLDLPPPPQVGNNDNGSVFPAQIGDAIPYVITTVLGILFKKEHDANKKRQNVIAETTVKLAENDESTDKGTLDIVYADNVLVDILCQDPAIKEKFDKYQTKYNTSATQFFKDMTRSFNQDFQSYYEKTHVIQSTKDPVIDTLKKVQDKVTPA